MIDQHENKTNPAISKVFHDIRNTYQALFMFLDTPDGEEKPYILNGYIRSDVFDTLEQAKAQMKAMKAAKIFDIALINDQSNYRISLGLYSHKSIANERLNALLAKGYQASMKPMERVSKMYWADIIYLPQSDDALNAVISGSHRSACSDAIKKGLIE